MAINPIPSIVIITIVGVITSVGQGEDVADKLWPEELFLPMERSFDYLGAPEFPEISSEECGSIIGTIGCIGEAFLAGFILIGVIVFNLFAFFTKLVVFLINAVYVLFSFVNLLLGWATFNIPGAPGWARVFFSAVVTGPLLVSAYQHIRGN